MITTLTGKITAFRVSRRQTQEKPSQAAIAVNAQYLNRGGLPYVREHFTLADGMWRPLK
jgi:hypothetical protein